MPIFKVNSNLKRDGQFYAAGSDIELSKADAKELLNEGVISDPEAVEVTEPEAPRTPKVKKPKGQKTETETAPEKTGGENKGDEDKDEGGDDNDAPKTVSRETTQEDLDADPALVEAGVQVGDMHDFPVVDTGEDNGADDL